MKRVALWLGTTPGFYSRKGDHFVWECMCDVSRIHIPDDFPPRTVRRNLREMKKTLDEGPCQCAI